MGSVPGSGRSPGEGNGNPLKYSYLGNPMDRVAGGLSSMGSHRVGHDCGDFAAAAEDMFIYLLIIFPFTVYIVLLCIS